MVIKVNKVDILKSLTALLKKSKTPTTDDVPEGLCPNCWGRHEYGGQFYEAVKNNNMDINSKNPDVGWVQDYANKHLLGIELKHKDDILVCNKCKITYRPT